MPEFRVRAILREAKAELANADAVGQWALWGLIGLAKQHLAANPSLSPRARHVLLQESLDAHRNALHHREDPENLSSVGTVLAELGRARESIDYFVRADRLARPGSPNHVIVLLNLATTHEELNEREAALAVIHRAVTVQPPPA